MLFKVQNPMVNFDPNPIQKTLQKARPVAHLFALKACNWSGLYYMSAIITCSPA
jgi:hypothetical protein